MALDVSTGFTAPRLAVMQPLVLLLLPPALQAGAADGPTCRACDGEHTSEERLSRPARYRNRSPRMNKTRLRNAVLTRF